MRTVRGGWMVQRSSLSNRGLLPQAVEGWRYAAPHKALDGRFLAALEMTRRIN